MTLYDDLRSMADTEHEKERRYGYCLRVCTAAACVSQHSDSIKKAFDAEVKARGLDEQIQVKGVGCMGLCAAGPLVMIDPVRDNTLGPTLYEKVTVEDVPEIVDALAQKQVVERLERKMDIPFFQRQVRIVLENSGIIDPENVDDYIAADGYQAFSHALTSMSPADVVKEITASGLRGRGGGGYPTGLKWSTVAKASGDVKYVICNADEGDPGAFMDRSVLESDPHRVLEGMCIAAYAIGASKGYVYVRAEYPLAIDRLKTALKQAKRKNLLGHSILNTEFDFDIEIRLGAGAFVCGEETALMASVEGRRGQPRPRPPYPSDHGLWGKPTLVNNVESYANVATILRKGADWFAGIGTEKSKGTKVFALAGQIENTGLIEVPMGVTLREIVYDIGGGTPQGTELKAIQTGGPSGGCIPADLIDLPVDYESLVKAGSFMGSGGMIIIDNTADMVNVAKYFMDFCKSESCGKCIPCRVGTAHMYNLIDKIDRGQATHADLDLLLSLCDLVANTSLCGLGKASPNAILSTLRVFRNEYEAKLLDGHVGAQPEAK
ncbi:MAG: NADH-quinone oxidoreductase subunit NuoF [Chloroflexi bacterium]|nr:NADH-quinone oxidoreductase subunit NuoF [Chloroflexota bacterium]